MNWIRKRIYWIAGIVVTGMLLWLVTTAVSVHSVRVEEAGTLFGRPVPATEYLKALEAVTHRAILTHGDHFRQNVPMQEIEAQAWERLLLLQEARRKEIRVSDREVVQELQSSPLFRNSQGQFDTQGYQVVMQYTLGTTPRVFEEETRENLMIQKLIQQVIGSPTASDEEIKPRFEEKKKEKPEEWKDFEAARPTLEKEVLSQKRFKNYFAWYQELLKRAKPQKKGGEQHPSTGSG